MGSDTVIEVKPRKLLFVCPFMKLPTSRFTGSPKKPAPSELCVSAALRAALTAELIGPRGPLARFVFREKKKMRNRAAR